MVITDFPLSVQIESTTAVLGRSKKVDDGIDNAKEAVFKTMDLMLERHGVIEHLVEETENLETSVHV